MNRFPRLSFSSQREQNVCSKSFRTSAKLARKCSRRTLEFRSLSQVSTSSRENFLKGIDFFLKKTWNWVARTGKWDSSSRWFGKSFCLTKDNIVSLISFYVCLLAYAKCDKRGIILSLRLSYYDAICIMKLPLCGTEIESWTAWKVRKAKMSWRASIQLK